MQTQVRSRIAPTPSGFLHLGNVFSFVLTWLIVRQNRGHLLLRIDDLDTQRRKMAYLDDIFSTLEWLELDYDEGASGAEDFLQNFSQEKRLPEYEKLLDELLLSNPPLIFECNCSRAEIQLQSPNGLYAGTCRDKIVQIGSKMGKINSSWRIKVPTEKITFKDILQREIKISLAECIGDFVIRKKDGFPAYQLASLSDDVKFGINYIVRGEDLSHSTAAQLFLAQVLDKKEFTKATFLHHPLLLTSDNQKLSKSAGATSVKLLREKMDSPAPILQWIAGQLHLNKKVGTLKDLLEEFELKEITGISNPNDEFAS